MLLLLLGAASFWSCGTTETHRTYDSAQAATSCEEWPRAAELWFELCQDETTRNPRAYLEAARALYETGDRRGACALLEQARREYPDDSGLLEFHASLLDRCGFHRASEATYTRLVALEPDRFSALEALGRLRLQLGLERGAEAPLLHAIEVSGGNAEVYAMLGRLYCASGRDVQGFESYGLAIAGGVTDPDVLIDASALAAREAVLAEVPDAQSRALGWLDTLCAQDPQNTRAYYLRGVYLQEEGRTDEAVLALRRAVETDPGCLLALTRLAALYAARGDREEAGEMIERALRIEQNPERRSDLCALLAED